MENINTTIQAVEGIDLNTLSKEELKKHCKRLLVIVKHLDK